MQDGVVQGISTVQTPASINSEQITSLYSSLRYISPVAGSDRVKGIATRSVGQVLSFLEETCPFVASATSNSDLLSSSTISIGVTNTLQTRNSFARTPSELSQSFQFPSGDHLASD